MLLSYIVQFIDKKWYNKLYFCSREWGSICLFLEYFIFSFPLNKDLSLPNTSANVISNNKIRPNNKRITKVTLEPLKPNRELNIPANKAPNIPQNNNTSGNLNNQIHQ